MWWVASVLGAICVATRLLPWHDAVSTTVRIGPILIFLAAITVVAELADDAEVFDVAAVRAARLGRGSSRRLFLLILMLGALTTIVLSLDTTAVLLTPVVLTVALRLDLSPLPFAMAAVWLANTASLLLPVSNLTNLLAVDKLHLSAAAFAGRMWFPAIAALVVTGVVLGTTYRRALARRYTVPPAHVVRDRPLFLTGALTCVALVPAFVGGLPVAPVAVVAAVILVGMFAWRHCESLRFSLVPWRLVLLIEGLFLVIATLSHHGLDTVLMHAAGQSSSAAGVARTAGVGALGSNLVNNLPTYFAVEPVTDGRHDQLLGLLLGTNLGPLILLWGSLATLLWRERCRAYGVRVGAWQFARVGLVGVPVLLAATIGALLITR